MTREKASHEHTPKSPGPICGPAAIAAVMLVTVVALRAIVSFSPQLWWMTDPRTDPTPTVGFGPAATAITDWLLILSLLLSVVSCAASGRKTHGLLILLWAAGLGFVFYQGMVDFESLRIGSVWTGSLAAALAALHLGQEPALRKTLCACLIALTLPLTTQGVMQVTYYHAQSVRDYEQNREEKLRQRGWAPGSTEQRKFEERLYQNEATGNFGLSNVFGSVMMALTLLGAGAAVSVWKSKAQSPKPKVLPSCLIATAGVVCLILSFSKGAVVATGATLLAMGAGWCLPRFKYKGVILGVLIVAAGIGGVAARGLMGEPKTAAGERSLLFRWHYWQAAGRMIEQHPVAGVGPSRFQDAYLVHKNPLNPEEVADPHSVFAAFTSTLGLGGWAWSAVILGLLVLAGLRIESPKSQIASHNPPSEIRRLEQRQQPLNPQSIILLIAAMVFSIEYAATLRILGLMGAVLIGITAMLGAMGWAAWKGKLKGRDGRPSPQGRPIGAALFIAAMLLPWMIPQLGAWLLGAAGFTAAALWLNRREPDQPMLRLGLFTAAAALLLHAQIEMSLTHLMAGPLLLTILGLAASGPGSAPRQLLDRAAIGLTAAVTLAGLLPLLKICEQGYRLRHAAQAVRTDNPRELAKALEHELPRLRQLRPPNLQAVRYESQYWLADLNQPDRAIAVLEEAIQTGLKQPTLLHALASTAEEAYHRTREKEARYLRKAAEASEKALKLDPYNFEAHAQAADLAWELGDRDKARRFYRRALELNDLAYLDPNKQLTQEQIGAIREKLK